MRKKFRIPRRPRLRYRRTLLAVYSIVRGDRTLLCVTNREAAFAYAAVLNLCYIGPLAHVMRQEGGTANV